ncbi:MAG: DUF6359 domain-containing protein [Prevotella sp.]|nr:DUF6359 domain-containing protein [Prevotella sp.]
MKRNKCHILLFLIALVLTTAGCEKGYYGEEINNTEDTEETEGTEGSQDTDDGSDDSGDKGSGDEGSGNEGSSQGSSDKGGSEGSGENADEADMLSVEQFMSQTLTGQTWVVGYVVGACSKTINNADFEPPFEYPQAILLADHPGETNKEKVITIGLPSGYKVRKELNLVDHPENYGKRVAIYGEQTTYLKVIGIKKPAGWKVY